MLQDVIQSIQEEREEVLSRARSAKIFLELAEASRLTRSLEILQKDLVKLTRETPESVHGVVMGSAAEPYEVSFKVRALRVRGASCSCQDSAAGNTCKHALALCSKWLLEQKKTWSKLGRALSCLSSEEV